MVPLVIPLVPMVMQMVPLALQIGTIGKPMVSLATNGTIGKITNGTIGRTPNRGYIGEYCVIMVHINMHVVTETS